MGKAKIIVDSGFWIALYTPEETNMHSRAMGIVDELENNEVLVPWPTLYEFVNTRLARRKEYLFSFEKFLQMSNVLRISDEDYKTSALQRIFELNISHHTSISLVDEILRHMILDPSLKIDCLVTFNRVDFEYPCQLTKVLIID